MEATRGSARGRWGTAVALSFAVLLLSALDAVPLVALPLAVLLVALPAERRWVNLALGTGVWALALLLPGGPLGWLSRGWGLLLGSAFLCVTLLRPREPVLTRALLALALTFGLGALGLAASGSAEAVDRMVLKHYQTVSSLTLGNLGARSPDSALMTQLGEAVQRVTTLQWTLFPAILGLQSLAALALASWWVARMRRQSGGPFALRPLREFRFNDQLIWLLIAGLVLIVLPVGALATRAGYNAVLFMTGLYALRGVGVFVFLAGGAPSLFGVVFGALAAIFLYPLILTAAVLVGLGDTWLDVRGRATLAPRA